MLENGSFHARLNVDLRPDNYFKHAAIYYCNRAKIILRAEQPFKRGETVLASATEKDHIFQLTPALDDFNGTAPLLLPLGTDVPLTDAFKFYVHSGDLQIIRSVNILECGRAYVLLVTMHGNSGVVRGKNAHGETIEWNIFCAGSGHVNARFRFKQDLCGLAREWGALLGAAFKVEKTREDYLRMGDLREQLKRDFVLADAMDLLPPENELGITLLWNAREAFDKAPFDMRVFALYSAGIIPLTTTEPSAPLPPGLTPPATQKGSYITLRGSGTHKRARPSGL